MESNTRDLTTCECTSKIMFTPIKRVEELAAAQQKFQQLVDEQLLEISQRDKDGLFYKIIYLCTKCGKDYVMSYVHKGFRGYYGPVFHEQPVNDKTFEMKSVHLRKLLNYLLEKGHKVSYNGKSIYNNTSGNWVNFGCCFDEKSIRRKFSFPDSITYSEHYDIKGGSISSFYDEETHDAIFGPHPKDCTKKIF